MVTNQITIRLFLNKRRRLIFNFEFHRRSQKFENQVREEDILLDYAKKRTENLHPLRHSQGNSNDFGSRRCAGSVDNFERKRINFASKTSQDSAKVSCYWTLYIRRTKNILGTLDFSLLWEKIVRNFVEPAQSSAEFISQFRPGKVVYQTNINVQLL